MEYFVTMAFLIFVVVAGPILFRTGWFLESVLSEILITFAIRTRKRFYKSRPSRLLFITSIVIAALTLFITFTPIGNLFEFIPLTVYFVSVVGLILIVYFALVEILKDFLMSKEQM